MKKTILTVLLLSLSCVWPLSSSAQGLEKGDQLVSVFAGGGIPTNQSGIYYIPSMTELDWGDAAFAYGVQYLNAITPYFALGVEVNGNHFSKASYSFSDYGESLQISSKMDVYNFMVASRITANPQAKTRFYFPFGLGFASAKNTVALNINGVGDSNREQMSSFSYYIGLGMEETLSENWVFGGEVRYNGFSFDMGKHGFSGSAKENYNFVSLLLKIAYKF